ncbi:MAG: D-alanine--D-alanine ligase family protein, partial [Acidimicrobiales bacterium]
PVLSPPVTEPGGDARIRLVVLFGGRSAEHEVSCTSALHVLRAVDRDRYDVVPIGITRDGRWVDVEATTVTALSEGAGALPSPDDARRSATLDAMPTLASVVGEEVVVLPLLHGPMGEDGTVQGLLELARVAYVGAGVLASATCMDKGAAKDVLAAHGLPQARHLTWRETDVDTARVGEELGWPVFVKPANMGSSVGVTKVSVPAELPAALATALRYDEYVVVEEHVGGREIEVAVLGNAEPQASVPGEIVPGAEFYDFDDKYGGDAAGLLVPAPLGPTEADDVRRLAVEAYRALRVDGMARVDFFYEEHGRDGGAGRGFLVNELNTIPGFTPISMFPRLWESSGLPYGKLIDELVRLAQERSARRDRFATTRD